MRIVTLGRWEIVVGSRCDNMRSSIEQLWLLLCFLGSAERRVR